MNENIRTGVVDIDYISHSSGNLKRPVVFTNGCFDILHRGHIDYLQRAACLGTTLVVGVNDDDSVRRLQKGSGRPFNLVTDRMEILAALRCVDYVVPFSTDTPLQLIKAVRPDHLVKGGDWSTDSIVGAEFVTSSGGQVHSLNFRFNQSTSSLVERIQSQVASQTNSARQSDTNASKTK